MTRLSAKIESEYASLTAVRARKVPSTVVIPTASGRIVARPRKKISDSRSSTGKASSSARPRSSVTLSPIWLCANTEPPRRTSGCRAKRSLETGDDGVLVGIARQRRDEIGRAPVAAGRRRLADRHDPGLLRQRGPYVRRIRDGVGRASGGRPRPAPPACRSPPRSAVQRGPSRIPWPRSRRRSRATRRPGRRRRRPRRRRGRRAAACVSGGRRCDRSGRRSCGAPSSCECLLPS